jgi:tRNA(Ile2) C34 agmatinyltransferase TiaS
MKKKELVIVRNSARCRLCGDEVESKSINDWKECSCGEIFVSGGKEYFRRGARDPNNIEDTSLIEEA